ncbi:serine/threonine-protein kinase [Streptomyces sp. NPDC093595]|uniref:serine/threonine-protein kinase n=1 Tax=Streptomyces sp. NPDC093595 TaxID=3366045 RepID=UPI003804E843
MKVRPWQIRPDFRLTAHVVAGRYRLDDPLGRGGAADVYEGLDLRLRRPVAVKVFRPESDAHTEEQFDRECHLLARLRHPGLVTVYDCGRDDGLPYLVMELIRGTTLRRRIAAAPPALDEVCRIGSALASALAHVHAAGVVHRDVKPSNILLDETGAPHLTDFGISQLADTTAPAAPAAAGALIGTAAYMAPEQVEGRAAGPAADIYSLGLVLLECVKGELEYDGTPLEAAIARLHRSPAIPQELPHGIAELLEAMTAADENRRPDALTCCEVLAAGAAAASAAGAHGDAAASGRAVVAPRKGDGSGDNTLLSRGTGAGPVTAAATTASGAHALAGSPKSTVRGAGSVHAGRAVTAGAALAALGVALTGLVGSLPAEGEDAAARPPRPATTASLPPEAARPQPSSPSAAPASRAVRQAAAPAESREAAAQREPAAAEREVPAAATARGGAGAPPEHAEGGPEHDKTKRPAKGKQAKHKKAN